MIYPRSLKVSGQKEWLACIFVVQELLHQFVKPDFDTSLVLSNRILYDNSPNLIVICHHAQSDIMAVKLPSQTIKALVILEALGFKFLHHGRLQTVNRYAEEFGHVFLSHHCY